MSDHTSISAEEAADRLAIRELVDAYAFCADTRDAEGQKALFTDDTHFVVYMAGQLVYQLAATGELYALPGAAMLASLSYHPGQFAAIVSAALSISFMLDFADLPRNVPRLARVLAAMRWPYLVLALALWIPALQPDRWLPNIVNLMLVLTTSGALVAGWLAWRRGSRQAGFFLISWLPLLCLTVLRVALASAGNSRRHA